MFVLFCFQTFSLSLFVFCRYLFSSHFHHSIFSRPLKARRRRWQRRQRRQRQPGTKQADLTDYERRTDGQIERSTTIRRPKTEQRTICVDNNDGERDTRYTTIRWFFVRHRTQNVWLKFVCIYLSMGEYFSRTHTHAFHSFISYPFKIYLQILAHTHPYIQLCVCMCVWDMEEFLFQI